MKISVYVFGKIKTKYWNTACKDFIGRIRHYSTFELRELKDSRFDEKDMGKAIEDESGRLLATLPDNAFFIALDSRGKMLDSPGLASLLNEKQNYGPAEVVFAIGGAFGFSKEVLQRANMVVSLSEMTFPHELARVILLEQIYRACTILRGEKYHK
ncbi:MAG: 23S rRNA (pseudouridine(1915)-N(3))-methyltransferase RlmH [Calditrichaeota bacterium]|nr:MAG: 23S rRNA (pseudouridine(1915)-N(3))-methyltransferase RlmH [Calditrichota bacterium]